MGDRRKRLANFLALHPRCYFCGEPATTIDHVPSRECFIERQWPEGYEFPACKYCNLNAGAHEQVVAFYRHVSDFSENGRSKPQIAKLRQGVSNNTPAMFPYKIPANVKKRVAARHGIRPADGQTYAGLPIVGLSKDVKNAFDTFSRRLTCALFYHHLGKVLPRSNQIMTFKLSFQDTKAQEILPEFIKFASYKTETKRQNTNIGDQFTYLWRADPDDDFFLYTAQFAKAFYIVGITAPPGEETFKPNWTSHLTDLLCCRA